MRRLRDHETLDSIRVGGIGRGRLRRRCRDVAGLDHGFKRFALVLQVALGDLDQIRDEVVAALQLHIDLGEGILEAITEGDEAVVETGDPDPGKNGDREQCA